MTLALWATVLVVWPTSARAQVGQSAMAPAGGLVNRAMAGLGDFGKDGPGWLYYGINAADRGLGYRGSYMTLGGFFPTVEDDLGGLWSADLRGHLSEYGGFFSNVGAVRKQFIGGTLLGVGVYWDYDGDQNQYSDTLLDTGNGNTYSFAGGYSYNQVGISGEWLTDFGNLRSNGYIPLGSTGQLVGPFLQNTVLCQNGVNAALGGADLEVGAYIPGLSDWAGMVSVGGYALGNTLYTFQNGEAAVPWFGGVYTRLDMTFRDNWDFSLQANNDSYFDWTGFARLTYRMGASRRRNVPDQMEQPMMRNEHIVRARQTPEVALNPVNGDPWRVFTVDNSATSSAANGTAEDPFTTLAQASAAATNPFDIVFVRVGDSAGSPYVTQFDGYQFAAHNQYLIGEGSSLALPTANCGPQTFFAGRNTAAYPRISNPLGPAIVIDKDGTTVSHLQITDSLVGISDRPAGLPAPDQAFVSDVKIIGGAGPSQRGIEIANSTGTFNFNNIELLKLSNDGLVVSANNGRVVVNSSTFAEIEATAIRVSGSGASVSGSNVTITATKGIAVNAAGANASILLSSGTIEKSADTAVVASGANSGIDLQSMTIRESTQSALATTGSGATITASRVTITKTGNPAIAVAGQSSTIRLTDSRVSDVAGSGAIVSGTNARFEMLRGSRITNATGDGIALTGTSTNNSALVAGSSIISNVRGNGISSEGGSVQVNASSITGVGKAGISATGVSGTNAVWVQGSQISNAQNGGIVVANSNLRVERSNPDDPSSTRTTIQNTGLFGVSITADTRLLPGDSSYNALVDSAIISNVGIGIAASANADINNPLPPGAPLPPNLEIPIIDLTATNNQISARTTGISLSAVFDGSFGAPGRPLSRVEALMTQNLINTASNQDILLATAGDPTTFVNALGVLFTAPAVVLPLQISAGSPVELENLNGGADVTIAPGNSRPAFISGLPIDLPPPAPPLP